MTAPAKPHTAGVASVTFDGGDIDDNGNWFGEYASCLDCRTTTAMRIEMTRTYLLTALVCGECGAGFGFYWV